MQAINHSSVVFIYLFVYLFNSAFFHLNKVQSFISDTKSTFPQKINRFYLFFISDHLHQTGNPYLWLSINTYMITQKVMIVQHKIWVDDR